MLIDPTFFQLLSDPTRLLIIEAMRGSECAVNDIVARVPIRQSGVSRHLRILSDAGMVRVRPVGQRRLYSLRPEPFDALNDWLTGYRLHWNARLDRLGAALDARTAPTRPHADAEHNPYLENGSHA